ncbi:MAG: hypothetical protein EPN21_11890 [Methylococcaceae bacterium]|nr:MAG: hypothetical protein EPN21_11890 [Methylococcaceae bacterium]
MNRQRLLIALLLSLTACTPPSQRFASDAGRRETGVPALHAVHDEQLRELMSRMNSLLQERFMTEPELDVERRRHARHIAATAQNLSQTIDAILTTLPTLQLSAGEQTAFLALANKLREQSQNLQDQAGQNRMDAIPGTLEQISTTCTSCHALFRKL